MIKIGLWGYYGHGEFCDDYIEYAIKTTFNYISGNNIEWVRLPTGKTVLDAIILGGGSLLGTPEPKLVGMLKENVDMPFYIYGTGFRNIEKSGFENLQYLWDRASLIAVRGESSIERLDEQGLKMSKVAALGDPIFLCSGQQKQDGGYIGGVHRPYIVNEQVLKEAFEFLKRKRNQDVKMFSFAKDQGDCRGGLGYEIYDLNINQTYNGLIQSSFWFGNRLHPFCIALMHSIPTIGLEIEFRKVEDVCSTLDYLYWLNISDFSGDTFVDMYSKLMENHKEIDEKVQIRISSIRQQLCNIAERILKGVTK